MDLSHDLQFIYIEIALIAWFLFNHIVTMIKQLIIALLKSKENGVD